MKRVGVDVGGTHTDLVAIDDATGDIAVVKLPTRAGDPSAAAIAALDDLCRSDNWSIDGLDYFMHGTTIATNIILEHNGSRVGLITTHGFRDILHIARHKRPKNFSLQLDLPWQTYPLVRRRHRIAVKERIVGPDGAVLVPLDEEAVRQAAAWLVAEGVEAIAICFMFSFLNPAHEQRALEIVREAAPELFVCASHGVIPHYREYERFSTTCLNAFVGPRTVSYLKRLDTALRSRGLKAGLHLMQSSGGSATLEAASQRPVTLLMSGPVGGLLGGIWTGKTAGFSSVISLDVGGTSADIGVAPDGAMQFKHLLDTRIGDYHAMMPMAEVDSIGAGGGSIAYIDAGGQFQVGPRSAGADPGPCCYGRGGTEPTATDCFLVLGRINSTGFLDGRLKLDSARARDAVETKLAKPLGLSLEAAALGALRILNHSMVQAIEINSVRRGYDPRDFALVGFGGAGPLFAVDVARDLSVPTVVVPPLPGLTSALGLLTSHVSYEFSRTLMVTIGVGSLDPLRRAESDLAARAESQLTADGFASEAMLFFRFADCRYSGQGYELRTAAPAGPIDAAFANSLAEAFHDEHRRRYGVAFPEKSIELVNLRVVGLGRIAPVEPRRIARGSEIPPPEAQSAERLVVCEIDGREQALPTKILVRDRLLAGNVLHGPAVIEQMDTTTWIPPGLTGRVDDYGNLIIATGEPR